MDKQQIQTMRLFGYSIEELPGRTVPKATYYKVENGQIVSLPNLPADPYHMSRYLRRGFTLQPPMTSGPLPTESQQGESIGFPCETCGKVLSTRLALAGHSRSHKTNLEEK